MLYQKLFVEISMYIHSLFILKLKGNSRGIKSTVRRLPRFEIAKSDFFSIQNFLKLKKKINNKYLLDSKCLGEIKVVSSNSAITLLISFPLKKGLFADFSWRDISFSDYNSAKQVIVMKRYIGLQVPFFFFPYYLILPVFSNCQRQVHNIIHKTEFLINSGTGARVFIFLD